MRYLFIDTSSSFCYIALIKDNELISFFNEEIKTDMASRVLPIIDNILNGSNTNLKDLNKIFVINGPGSFTGIRVGITIAKTLAWSLNIDVIPLSSLELLATTNTNKKYVVPMIDARRGNVFGAIYDKELNVIKEDQFVNIKQLLIDVDNDYELVSQDVKNLDTIKPNIDVIKIIKKHENDYPINPHNLNPNYLKLTEAEESKLRND